MTRIIYILAFFFCASLIAQTTPEVRVVTKAKYAILSNGNKAKVVFARNQDDKSSSLTINYSISSTGSGNNTIDQSTGSIVIPADKENVQLDITNTGGTGEREFTVALTSGSYVIDDETVDGSADYSEAIFYVRDTEPPLAFPTAYGSGAYVTGGKGGKVVHVNTLATGNTGSYDATTDTYSGTLEYALTREFTRTIVFDVSGVINLNGTIFLDNTSGGGRDYDNFTIAGETAPYGGITIRGSLWMADVENVIIRYVRFYKEPTFTGFDALTVGGTSSVIVDHVSAMNGSDEGLSITGYAQKDGAMTNVTMQNCLLSANKTGTIFGSVTSREFGGQPCYINNVNINTTHRFPNTAGDGDIEVINNLVYNWGDSFRLVNIINAVQLNHINNAYVGGAKTIQYGSVVNNTDAHKVNLAVDNTLDARIYTDGNFVTDLLDGTNTPSEEWNLWTVFVTANGYTGGDPTPTSIQTTTQHPRIGRHYPIKTQQWVRDSLIHKVGANRTLDENGDIVEYTTDVDTREKNHYINDTGIVYTLDVTNFDYGAGTPTNTRPAGFDTDKDGIPNAWETANGLTNGTNDANGYDLDSDYTNLQMYLFEIDGDVENVPVTGVSWDATTATIQIGQSVTTTWTVTPGNATNPSVSFSSSNTSVLSNAGVALSAGTATYTITTSDGSFTDNLTVTVTAAPATPVAGQNITKKNKKNLLIKIIN